MRRHLIQTTRELMQRLSPRYVRGRTLDLGAGTTKYRSIFAPYISEYVTCDCFKSPQIDFVEDAHNLSFPDASFDTVICTMVFEHVSKPWQVAGEIQRILRPGGHCIVCAPFMFPYHQDPDDYFRFSTAGLASLFSELETIECRGYRGFFSLLESLVRMCFYNPYQPERQGFLRRNIHRFLSAMLTLLDRLIPSPNDLYCEVYFVGHKPPAVTMMHS